MNAFLCSSGVSEWLRLESKCCITILKCRYWMNSLFFHLYMVSIPVNDLEFEI
jgi:hypothetical protein